MQLTKSLTFLILTTLVSPQYTVNVGYYCNKSLEVLCNVNIFEIDERKDSNALLSLCNCKTKRAHVHVQLCIVQLLSTLTFCPGHIYCIYNFYILLPYCNGLKKKVLNCLCNEGQICRAIQFVLLFLSFEYLILRLNDFLRQGCTL